MRVAIANGLLALTLAAASLPTRAANFTCKQGSGPPIEQIHELTAPDYRYTFSIGDAEGWLSVEEMGRELSASGSDGVAVERLSQPLRYGKVLVTAKPHSKVEIVAADGNPSPTRFRAEFHCRGETEATSRFDALLKLAKFDAQLNIPSSRAQAKRVGAELDRFLFGKPDGISAALASHYRGLALMVTNEYAEASSAFAEANANWAKTGLERQALAARLGLVEAEFNAGNVRASLEASAVLMEKSSIEPYFAARARAQHCLALETLGDLPAAEHCYSIAITRLGRIGERAEAAVTLQNYANLMRKREQFALARNFAHKSIQTAAGPHAPMTRGRAFLTLASVDRQTGEVASALRNFNLAQEQFAQAGHDALQWRATTWLLEGTLLQQIGASAEAYEALHYAVELLPTSGIQYQHGLAAMFLSFLESDNSRLTSAMLWAWIAHEVFLHVNSRAASEEAQLTQLELELQNGHYSDVERGLMKQVNITPVNASHKALLTAEVATAQGKLNEAGHVLSTISGTQLSMRDQIRFSRLDALRHELAGDEAGAQMLRGIALDQINSAATHASPVIQDLIARQSEPLRRSAVNLALRSEKDRPDTEKASVLWAWVARNIKSFPNVEIEEHSLAAQETFDRAVAAELLAPTPPAKVVAGSGALPNLMSMLAQSSAISTTSRSTMELAQLPPSLDVDSVLIAYIDGDTRGALLWITRDSAKVIPAATPKEVRYGIVLLRELLRTPSASLAEIDVSTAKLSDALLQNVLGAPPKRLLVLADDAFNGIPWAALHWPGHTEPLIETTTMSLVRLARASPRTAHQGSQPTLRVLTAAQRTSNEKSLPPLANVDVEQKQISTALDGAIRIDANSQASRATVLDALHARGDFVHIAAHGTAQPQRIGYAGIWLEPSVRETTPPFLSWLDILNTDVRADLVVLNACQLGDSGAAVNGNLSFAAAVARAGARRVVASLWPVSDAAAALWVPAFYTALHDNPDDAAGALRAAQLRLAHSRAFAHPFFWAGMQAIERLDIAPVPAAAGAVAARATHRRPAATTATMH